MPRNAKKKDLYKPLQLTNTNSKSITTTSANSGTSVAAASSSTASTAATPTKRLGDNDSSPTHATAVTPTKRFGDNDSNPSTPKRTNFGQQSPFKSPMSPSSGETAGNFFIVFGEKN